MTVTVTTYGTGTESITTTDDAGNITATFRYLGVLYKGMPPAFVNALMIYCNLKNL